VLLRQNITNKSCTNITVYAEQGDSELGESMLTCLANMFG